MLWCLNILYYVLILALIVLDQMSKTYAVLKLRDAFTLPVRLGIFKFIIVRNPGAAFGLMAKKQLLLKAVTLVLILLLLGYTTAMIVWGEPLLKILSLTFITGGAFGNFIDRFRLNHVIDFISLNIKGFPVFNLADLFIFSGCVLYIAFF
ncbi:MAG: signal peptidase II [Bacillota bacterium]